MIVKISCGRSGQVIYEFDNGNIISFLWSWGSYSDNHMERVGFDPELYLKNQDWESTTVEVYSMGEDSNGFTRYLEKKYGNNPAGYVDVKDIPAIIKRADRKNG